MDYGVEADIYQAVEYYIEAAKQAIAKLYIVWEHVFEFGEGIEQNVKEHLNAMKKQQTKVMNVHNIAQQIVMKMGQAHQKIILKLFIGINKQV